MSSRILMTVLAALLVSSVLVTGVISQDDPDQERDPNVIGKVMDAKTEKPLDAYILIHGTEEQSWRFDYRTDDQGIFRAHVPPGKVYITIEAEGYQTQRLEKELKEGGELEMRILLEPKETDKAPEPNVYGHVIDIEEDPVHAIVVFYNENTDGVRAESDRSGMFKLHIAPGTYRWKASAEGFNPEDGELDVPREGETRVIIMLKRVEEKPPMGAIHGMVANLENEPIPGAYITFMALETPRDPSVEGDGGVHGAPDMIFEAKAGKDGTFVIKLPLGIYMMEVHAEGYHPYMMEIALTPDHPEAKAFIEMEWAGYNEKFEEPNIRLSLEMTDEDSDGNPEKLHIIAHVDDNEEPDLVFMMIDKNSDGNPESVKFEMDMEKHFVVYVLEMIFNRMDMQSGYLPGPEEPYWEEDWDKDGDGIPDDPDHDGQWDENGEWTYDGEEMPPEVIDRLKDLMGVEEEEPLDAAGEAQASEDENDDPNTVSDKGSGSNDNGKIPAMVGAIGVLLIVVTLIVLAGYMIRIKKRS